MEIMIRHQQDLTGQALEPNGQLDSTPHTPGSDLPRPSSLAYLLLLSVWDILSASETGLSGAGEMACWGEGTYVSTVS